MKKYLIYAVLVLSLLAASCSKYNFRQVAGDPTETKIYTLDNGLKLYMSVNKETPRIQTYIAVKVGGKNDPAETTGLAHYFEHIMFKGTENFGTSDYATEKLMLDEIERLFEVYRKTTDEAQRTAIYHKIDSISYEASKYSIPNEYQKLMQIIGSNGSNAFTTPDMTVYVEDIPSNQIENWARIEADRFKNLVVRGFHTELETIYEEKNMSLTNDYSKSYEAISALLFPNHPYGTQTVLGSQQSLKNPSITNVKMCKDTYYVPNNMAICVAGDFNPYEMVAVIEKYFGDMKPKDNLPVLEYKPEAPITTPVSKEVFGLDAENVSMAWRIGGANSPDADIAQIVNGIIYNGKAGLIDLNINQQQKALGVYGYANLMPDYGMMLFGGRPKQGQGLEDVRDIILAEVGKLRSGDFDETLIKSTINNLKLQHMQSIDSNNGRASWFYMSYINGTDWAEEVKRFERLEKITKQEVVEWANRNLGENSYAVVYKREGKDNELKIDKPQITTIQTNRDNTSAFLNEVKFSQVKPIEPVFVDFDKDMGKLKAQSDIEVLYKKNETTDLFSLIYVFDTGIMNDPALNLAFNYINYLGSATKTAEQIATEMYGLACNYYLSAGDDRCYVVINGLSENMGKAVEIFEDLIYNAKPDDAILADLKADLIKVRADAKLNQQQNFGALQRYIIYGPEAVKAINLTNAQIETFSSQQLLGKVKDLFNKQHTILYFGPKDKNALLKDLAEFHKTPDTLTPLKSDHFRFVNTDENKVFLSQYDANQIYYMQFSNIGDKIYDVANSPEISLYNSYFSGNIVFNEMREVRGLAYHSSAGLIEPSYAGDTYGYMAIIATQNDKMEQAIKAFDEIINNMPQSEAAFEIAKDGLITSIRTNRVVKDDILWRYLYVQRLGITQDPLKVLYDNIQNMTLADVKAAQEKWVKDRKFVYGILGNAPELDMEYLKTLGTVKILTQEEIFGY